MITYSNAKAKSITNAVKKAKQVKPLVKPVAGEFGKYQVCGSKGDCYIVTYAKQGQEFTADCNCKGGRAGRVCYHIVSASSLYKQAVTERAAQKAAYTVKTIAPDGVSFDSDYDDYDAAYNDMNLFLNSKSEYWQGFSFELYNNLLGGLPIWSRSVPPATAPALVEQVEKPNLFCSNCQTRYATGPDGLCSLCRDYTPEMAAKDRSDLFG